MVNQLCSDIRLVLEFNLLPWIMVIIIIKGKNIEHKGDSNANHSQSTGKSSEEMRKEAKNLEIQRHGKIVTEPSGRRILKWRWKWYQSYLVLSEQPRWEY